MQLKPIALAAALVAGPAAASDDMKAVLAEMKRLADRVEALEKQNKELEKSLASERLSEKEPEIVTRLKAVEFQTLSMQKQARQIEALEGISVGASLTAVGQRASRDGLPAGAASRQSRANYRGDVSVTLPGGEMGDIEGKIFTHFRFGQGNGVGLRPTYTSTPNTTAFETNAGPDDSFAILAQAWYQLTVPLPRDGLKANSKEHIHLTAGKIDSFVFFDQNAAASATTASSDAIPASACRSTRRSPITSRCSAATATRARARCASTARSPLARKSPATPGDAGPTRSAQPSACCAPVRTTAGTRRRWTSTATACSTRALPAPSGSARSTTAFA